MTERFPARGKQNILTQPLQKSRRKLAAGKVGNRWGECHRLCVICI